MIILNSTLTNAHKITNIIFNDLFGKLLKFEPPISSEEEKIKIEGFYGNQKIKIIYNFAKNIFCKKNKDYFCLIGIVYSYGYQISTVLTIINCTRRELLADEYHAIKTKILEMELFDNSLFYTTDENIYLPKNSELANKLLRRIDNKNNCMIDLDQSETLFALIKEIISEF